MASAFVQSAGFVLGSGVASVDVTINSVVSGNALIAVAIQSSTSARVYSASSNVSGSFTKDVEAHSRTNAILNKRNVASGTHVVTVSMSSGTATFRANVIEVSGLDNSATPVTASHDDGASVSTHNSAPAGSIDTTGASFVVCTGVLGSSAGVSSTTAGATYTEIDAGSIQFFMQYKAAASALTDDRGEWSSGGTARQNTGAMVAYYDAAAATGSRPIFNRSPRFYRRSA